MSEGVKRALLLAGLTGAVLVLATLAPASRADAQDTRVRLEVPEEPVTIGDAAFSVEVVVDDVENLGAFEFELRYDESILRYVDVAEGPFLASSGRVVECLEPRVSPGSLRFVCVTLGRTPAGPDGTGTLATIGLEPIGAGISPARFVVMTLARPNAEEIPAVFEDASVSVATEEGVVPQPATSTPVEAEAGETATATPGEADGTSTSTEASDDGGTNWALWGSVIGVVAALAAAAGGVWWFLARRPA